MTKQKDPGLYRKMFAVLTPGERRRAVVQLILSLTGVFLETVGIGMIIPTLIVLTREDPGAAFPVLRPVLDALGNPTQTQLIVAGMLALGGIYLVKSAFLIFLAWTQVQFNFNVRTRLSQTLFRLYLRQPYPFHLQHNSSYLMRNANAETGQFVQGALQPLMMIAGNFMLLAGLGALLLALEPIGALVVALVVGSTAWGILAFTRRRLTKWGSERREHEGHRMLHMRQGLESVKDIKLLGRESEFLRRYHFHNQRVARASRLERTMNRLPRVAFELLAVSGLVVLVLTMLAQHRNMANVLPVLGAFGAAAFRMMPSLTAIVSSAQSIRFTMPVVDSVYEELKLQIPDSPARPANAASRALKNDLRMADVTFMYENAPAPALDGFSMVMHRGESVGLIGPSGSGKSTAVDLLLGLLAPSEGQVLADGVDIREDMRGWQDQIGYVPQAIILTDDSLRNNVAFGIAEKEIDEQAVERAISAAQLQDFVAALPQGLDTSVGERGTRLSGGQRQRIGIARALYHDPSILVLDEATSALDTETEEQVMEAVTALHGSKTIVIVAHRLSTVEHCDRIYRLEKGRVVEEGPASVVLGVDKGLESKPDRAKNAAGR